MLRDSIISRFVLRKRVYLALVGEEKPAPESEKTPPPELKIGEW